MAIRKRGVDPRTRKARWQVRVRPFPEMTLPTREAAQTVELDLKLRKKLGHLYQEKPIPFGNELDGYVSRKIAMGGKRGMLRPRSIEFLHQTARGLEQFRHIVIPNLRRSFVEDCIAARAAAAPVAAGNELQLLKTCLRHAASRGQTVDPGIFEIPAISNEAAEGVALEYPRQQEIASFMPERIKRVVPLCGTVGLRFTEAMTLTDDRVDLDAGEILIPRGLNKSRQRKGIPLANFELQLLREQLMARPTGTSLVFPTEKNRVYSKSGFRSIWLPALLAVGLAHKESNKKDEAVIVAEFKFHWLRHSAISLMAQAGMKPELIAERVGHKDGGALIYRRYRHLFPSEMRAAVGLLDTAVAALGGQGVVERAR